MTTCSIRSVVIVMELSLRLYTFENKTKRYRIKTIDSPIKNQLYCMQKFEVLKELALEFFHSRLIEEKLGSHFEVP